VVWNQCRHTKEGGAYTWLDVQLLRLTDNAAGVTQKGEYFTAGRVMPGGEEI
jgi:hypothetical protein